MQTSWWEAAGKDNFSLAVLKSQFQNSSVKSNLQYEVSSVHKDPDVLPKGITSPLRQNMEYS